MEGNHFHIQGEAIQFISNANLVQQNHNLPSAPSPLVEENGGGNDSSTTYGLYVQHDSVDVPSLLRKAERHVVLHAAYYPKYGLDSQGMVLMEALRGNPTDASRTGGDFRHPPITPVPGHFGGRHRHRGTLRTFLHYRSPRPLADHTQPENLRDVRGVDGAEVGRKQVDR